VDRRFERAPLRRLETGTGAPTVSPPTKPTLEVRCSSECCMRSAGGHPLVPHRAPPSTFPSERRSCRPPSPDCLRKRVHPLVSSTPLQSAAVPGPPHASRRRAPSMGFAVPSSRPQPAASLRWGSTPVAFPSSAFLTPSTVCSATSLVGLFHPTATSRVSPFRVSVSHAAGQLFVGSCPLVVGAGSLPMIAHWRRNPSPRPQGFTPRERSPPTLR